MSMFRRWRRDCMENGGRFTDGHGRCTWRKADCKWILQHDERNAFAACAVPMLKQFI